ncbi:hypothetical protein EMCRGX_G029453 [Ephydatia muelleri]
MEDTDDAQASLQDSLSADELASTGSVEESSATVDNDEQMTNGRDGEREEHMTEQETGSKEEEHTDLTMETNSASAMEVYDGDISPSISGCSVLTDASMEMGGSNAQTTGGPEEAAEVVGERKPTKIKDTGKAQTGATTPKRLGSKVPVPFSRLPKPDPTFVKKKAINSGSPKPTATLLAKTIKPSIPLKRKDVSPGNKTVTQREHEEPTEEISTPLECEPSSDSQFCHCEHSRQLAARNQAISKANVKIKTDLTNERARRKAAEREQQMAQDKLKPVQEKCNNMLNENRVLRMKANDAVKLQKRNKELRQELTKANEEREQLSMALAKTNSDLDKTNSDLDKTREAHKRQVVEMESKIEEARETAQQSIRSAEEHYSFQAEEAKMEAEEKLREEVARIENEVEQKIKDGVRQRMDELEETFRQKCLEAQQRVEEAERIMQIAKEEEMNSKQRSEAMKEEVKLAEMEKTKMTSKRHVVREDLMEPEGSPMTKMEGQILKEAEQAMQNAKNIEEAARQDVIKAHLKVEELEDMAEQKLRQNKEEYEQRMQELRQRNEESECQLKELRQRNEESECQLKELKQRNEESECQLKELRQRNEESECQLKEMRQRNEESECQLKELRQRNEESECQLQGLEELRQKHKQYEERIQENEERIQEYEDRIQENEERIQENEERIQENEELKHHEYECQIQELEELGRMGEENEQMAQQLRELREQNKECHQRVQELEEFIIEQDTEMVWEPDNKISQLEAELSAHASREAELTEALHKANAQIAALRVSAGSSSWSDKGIESRDRQSSEHAVDEDGEENEEHSIAAATKALEMLYSMTDALSVGLKEDENKVVSAQQQQQVVIASLQDQLTKKNQQFKEIKDRTLKLRISSDNHQDCILRLEQAQRLAKEVADSLQRKLAESEQRNLISNEKLQNTITKHEGQNKMAVREIEALKAQLSQREKDIKSLVDQASARQCDIVAINETLSQREREVQTLSEELSRKGQQNHTLSDQLSQKEQEVQILKGQLSHEQQDIAPLIDQISQKEQQVLSLSDQLSKKEQEMHRLGDQLSQKEQDTHTLTDQLSQKEQEIRILTDQQSLKEQDIHTLTDQLSQKEQDIHTLTDQLSQKEQDLHTLTDQLSQKEQDIHTLTDQLSQKEQDLHTLTDQLSQKKQDIHTLTNQLSQKEQDLHTLTDQLSQKEQDIHTLTDQLSQKKQDIHTLTNQLSQKEQDIHTLTDQLSQKEQDTHTLTDQLSQKEQDLHTLTDQLSQKEQDIHTLTDQLSQKEQDIHTLTDQLSQKEQTLTDQLFHQVTTFEQQSHNEQAAINPAVSDLKDQLAFEKLRVLTLTDSLSKKEQDLTTVNKQLSTKDQDIATLTEQLSMRQQDIATLTKQLSSKDQDKFALKDQLTQIEIDMESTATRLSQKAYHIENLTDKLNQSEKDNAVLRKQLFEREQLISALTAQLSSQSTFALSSSETSRLPASPHLRLESQQMSAKSNPSKHHTHQKLYTPKAVQSLGQPEVEESHPSMVVYPHPIGRAGHISLSATPGNSRIFVAVMDYDPLSLCSTGRPDLELALPTGAIVEVYGEMNPQGYYEASFRGRRGLVPANIVQELDVQDPSAKRRLFNQMLPTSRTSSRASSVCGSLRHGPPATPTHTPQKSPPQKDGYRFIAEYDYSPEECNFDCNELAFKEGSRLKVFGQETESGYFEAELDGRRGLVPARFLREASPAEDYLNEKRRFNSSSPTVITPDHTRRWDRQESAKKQLRYSLGGKSNERHNT